MWTDNSVFPPRVRFDDENNPENAKRQIPAGRLPGHLANVELTPFERIAEQTEDVAGRFGLGFDTGGAASLGSGLGSIIGAGEDVEGADFWDRAYSALQQYREGVAGNRQEAEQDYLKGGSSVGRAPGLLGAGAEIVGGLAADLPLYALQPELGAQGLAAKIGLKTGLGEGLSGLAARAIKNAPGDVLSGIGVQQMKTAGDYDSIGDFAKQAAPEIIGAGVFREGFRGLGKLGSRLFGEEAAFQKLLREKLPDAESRNTFDEELLATKRSFHDALNQLGKLDDDAAEQMDFLVGKGTRNLALLSEDPIGAVRGVKALALQSPEEVGRFADQLEPLYQRTKVKALEPDPTDPVVPRLQAAAGDQRANLEKALNIKPGTGIAQNPETRIELPDGKAFHVGVPEGGTGKRPQAWVEENDAWMTPEETQAARVWYDEVNQKFRQHFGDDADRITAAWLASQQNKSVSQGFQDVLVVLDQIAGYNRGKKGGLAHGKITDILSGKDPDKGFAAKLLDFTDSSLGKKTRTIMGNDPRGGAPFVADIHTARDSGHADHVMLQHVMDSVKNGATVNGKRVAGMEVTATQKITTEVGGVKKTQVVPTEIMLELEGQRQPLVLTRDLLSSPSAGKYEGISRWGQDLTRHLNETGYAGGNWKPYEAQAVGWMRMLKTLGRKAETIDDAFQIATRRISSEANYDMGGVLPKIYPSLRDLPEEAQRAITQDSLTTLVREIIDRLGGSLRFIDAKFGPGYWHEYVNPSMQFFVMGSKDAARVLRDSIASATDQGGTAMVTFGIGGKNKLAAILKRADGTPMSDAEAADLMKYVFDKYAPKNEAIRKRNEKKLAKETAKGVPAEDVRLSKEIEIIPGMSGHVLPNEAGHVIAGLSEAQYNKVLQEVEEWSKLRGIDLRAKSTSAESEFTNQDWQKEKTGGTYRGTLRDTGGVGLTRNLPDFRRRWAELLEDAFEQHAPGRLDPAKRQQRIDAAVKPLLYRGQPLKQAAVEGPDASGAVPGSVVKGAFRPGEAGAPARIGLTSESDFSTYAHEIAHYWRTKLAGQDRSIVEAWSGAKGAGEWTTAAEEKWARALERYLAEGVAPNKRLEGIFAKAKGWMSDIYGGKIEGTEIDVEIDAAVRGVMDRISGGPRNAPSALDAVPAAIGRSSDEVLFQERRGAGGEGTPPDRGEQRAAPRRRGRVPDDEWAAMPERDKLDYVRAVERDAYVDDLTQIANRRAYNVARESGELDGFVTVAFDGSNVKYVNDTKGHGMGDDLIKGYVAVIQRAMGELGFEPKHVYRMGGDEFAAAIPNSGATFAQLRAKIVALLDENDFKITGSEGTEAAMPPEIFKGLKMGRGENYHDADLAANRDTERIAVLQSEWERKHGRDEARSTWVDPRKNAARSAAGDGGLGVERAEAGREDPAGGVGAEAEAILRSTRDPAYLKAVDLGVKQGSITQGQLQRELGLSKYRAARIMRALEADGIVGPIEAGKPRELQMSAEELAARAEALRTQKAKTGRQIAAEKTAGKLERKAEAEARKTEQEEWEQELLRGEVPAGEKAVTSDEEYRRLVPEAFNREQEATGVTKEMWKPETTAGPFRANLTEAPKRTLLSGRMGEPGKRIGRELNAVDRMAAQESAEAATRLANLERLPVDVKQKFVDAMLKKTPLEEASPAIRSQLAFWREYLPKMGDRATDARIGVYDHSTKETVPFQKLSSWELPKVFEKDKQIVVEDGREGAFSGSFMRHRGKDGADPTGENIAGVLRDYVDRGNMVIAQAKILGARRSKGLWTENSAKQLVRGWADEIEKAGGNGTWMRENGPKLLGKTEHGAGDRVAQDILALESITKLTLSIFSQVTQQAAIAARGGLARTVLASAKTAKQMLTGALEEGGKDGLEKVLRTGALQGTIARSIAGQADTPISKLAHKVLKFTGFTPSEQWNRLTAASVGMGFAQDLFKEMKTDWDKALINQAPVPKRVAGIRRELGEMGVDVEKAIEVGHLSEQDVANAGWYMAERTQHASGRMHVPPIMSGSPWRSVLFQFWGYTHKQLTMQLDDFVIRAVKEAREGNYQPLTRIATFIGVGGTSAAALGWVKDQITGSKDREVDERLARSVSMMLALDNFDRMYKSLKQGRWYQALPVGPALRDAGVAVSLPFRAKNIYDTASERDAELEAGNERDAERLDVARRGKLQDVKRDMIGLAPATRVVTNRVLPDDKTIGKAEVYFKKKQPAARKVGADRIAEIEKRLDRLNKGSALDRRLAKRLKELGID